MTGSMIGLFPFLLLAVEIVAGLAVVVGAGLAAGALAQRRRWRRRPQGVVVDFTRVRVGERKRV